MRHQLLSVAAFVIGMSGTSATAVVLPSLSRTTFQTAIAGATTLGVQNFDALAAGTVLATIGDVTYGASTGSPLVTSSYLTSTGENGLGRTGVGYFLATDTASFTFAKAITAFAIDINTFATANGAYSVLLDTGDTSLSIFESFPARGTGQFIGFVSNTPFTSVTLRSTGLSYTLDTLIYGAREAVVTPGVPEPAAWAMFIVGFGVVGAAQRRRLRAVAA